MRRRAFRAMDRRRSLVPCFCSSRATAWIYALSLHDALPISLPPEIEAAVEDADAAKLTAWLLLAANAPTLEEVGILSDRKSTRLNSSHVEISYAVFCLKKKTWTADDRRFPVDVVVVGWAAGQ